MIENVYLATILIRNLSEKMNFMQSITSILAKPVIHWLNKKKAVPSIPLCDYDKIRHELRPCDVILIEGRSRVSEIIKLITQSPWSHACLYIGRIHNIEDESLKKKVSECININPEDQLIIESELGTGTIIRPLAYYKNEHIRICRPKGLTYQDAQIIYRYCISKLGFGYDIRQILDLARLLFPWWIMPRKWRSSLFKTHIGEYTKTVCSTMIAESFNQVQFPILPIVKINENKEIRFYRKNPKLCVPSDFDYSPYFEIIKYPFIDFNHHADYRLLPWSGDLALLDKTPNELDQK